MYDFTTFRLNSIRFFSNHSLRLRQKPVLGSGKPVLASGKPVLVSGAPRSRRAAPAM